MADEQTSSILSTMTAGASNDIVSALLERDTVDSDEILECFAKQDVTRAA